MTEPFEHEDTGGGVSPGADLSQFDTDNPANRYEVTSDDRAIHDIKRRTTTMGRVATVLILGGAGAFAFMYVQSERAHEAQVAELEQINQLANASEVPARLRAMLPSVTDPELKARIMLNLGHFHDAESVPLLTAALDEPGIVRRDASVALAMIGSPKADSARGKLLSVLTDTDEIDRSCVVWALAVLGEHAASDAILKEFINGTLQDKPGFEPGVIARAIGIEKLSSPEILNHEDAGVRAMTAHALAEAASPEVVDPLAKLLSAEIARNPQSRSTEVIRAATEGLGRSGDPRAAEPLFALLEAQPAMRGSVIDALSQSTAAPSLVTLLGHAKDDKTRLDLVNLLANTRDPRGADALAGMLTNADPAVQLKAALGLADLGDVRAVDTLLAFAGGPDNPKADQALFALRDVTKNGITGKLMAIVKEYPYRNASVLRALGATKDPAANGMLEGQLNGDDVGAAAMALADLGSATGFKKLMAMLPRPKNLDMRTPEVANETVMQNRKAAIQGLGRFGRSEAADGLAKVIEDPMDDPRLRSLAAAAFGASATDAQMSAAMGRVKGASVDDDSRAFYMEALWQRPRPALTGDAIALIANSTSSPVRLAAAIAVGYTGDATVEPQLLDLLTKEVSARDAAIALALFGSEDAVKKVIEALRANRDLEDRVRSVMTEDSDTFHVLTTGMFDSGQFWRRARAARQLATTDGKATYPYAWVKAIEALRMGWDGTNGVSKRAARQKLWEALTGANDDERKLAGLLLLDMPERGLLLRARDEGGPGGQLAGKLLRGDKD